MRKKFNVGKIVLLMLLLLIGVLTEEKHIYAKEMPKNPTYNEDTEAGKWDYVYFGRYPQSEVTGSELTNKIKKAVYNKNGDAIVDGKKYRKVDGHYYLYEPIKWKVLSNDGNSLVLLADMVICKGGESPVKYDSEYPSSLHRSMLNGYESVENVRHIDCSGTDGSFYDMAFYDEEKEIMELQEVSNCYDYVIIPSMETLEDSTFGFGSSYSRIMEESDYVAYEEEYFWCCEYEGTLINIHCGDGTDGYGSAYDDASMIPQIKINLDSNLWSMECPETEYKAKPISEAKISLSKKSFAYDGKAKKPKVTVKADGATLVENIDYRIVYKNNVEAGTATVQVHGMGQYAGVKNVEFKIRKKVQKISVKEKFSKYVGDKSFKLDVVRIEGNGAFTYTSSNKRVVNVNKYGTVKIVGGGKAIITVTAKETDKYEATSVDIEVTVSYKITYKLDGGKNNSKNPSKYFNQKITLKNPTKKGHAFKGWYTDKKFKNKITKITTKNKKNLTLYARWEKIDVKDTEIKSLKNLKGKKLKLVFKEVKKADGYQIMYCTDNLFEEDKEVIYTKDENITIGKLKKNKTYYIKVRAYRVDSTGKRIYGEFTDVGKITIKK